MTEFRKKSCPKCKRNYDDDGPVCHFCREDARIAESKREKAPEHYWIECLVEREGDTHLHVGNVPYSFKRNELGHAVCLVNNLSHYRALLKTSRDFVPYNKPEAPQEMNTEPLQGDELINAIHALAAQGKKDSEIAADLGQGLSRQAVTKLRTA